VGEVEDLVGDVDGQASVPTRVQRRGDDGARGEIHGTNAVAVDDPETIGAGIEGQRAEGAESRVRAELPVDGAVDLRRAAEGRDLVGGNIEAAEVASEIVTDVERAVQVADD